MGGVLVLLAGVLVSVMRLVRKAKRALWGPFLVFHLPYVSVPAALAWRVFSSVAVAMAFVAELVVFVNEAWLHQSSAVQFGEYLAERASGSM